MSDNVPPPIFIVGCQRSGTTLLRLMLDSHPNISCGPETRFLADLAAVMNKGWETMGAYGLPREQWEEKFADLFDSFQRDYARSRGKSRWADKTPRYALSLAPIVTMFPTCQIIHVIRDGRDVVASHRDRWGYWSAVKSVEKWPRYIVAARSVTESLPPNRYREVRYESLVTDTEATLRGLLEFLNEPWDPAVLQHDESPHDVFGQYASRVAKRRAGGDGQGAVYSSRVGAYKTEMDPLLRLLFRMRAKGTLHELGYH
jgi:Sulfotransferase family